MDKIITISNSIDMNIIYIMILMIFIMGVISLIKKAIKIGLIVISLCVVLTYGGVWLNSIKNNVSLNVDGNTCNINIKGTTYNLDLSKLKDITMADLADGNIKILIRNKDGKEVSLEAPKIAKELIKQQADKLNIKLIEK